MINRLAVYRVLFTAITIAIVVAAPILQADDTLQQRVDRLVQPYLDAEIVMGMSIGVFHDDKEHFFGYGLTKQEGKTPDADTIYEIGSTSKVFTGVLLADAVTQGRVRLDQPAGELLPDGVRMPSFDDQQITLQHLATHASGLPKLPSNLNPMNPENPYADYELKDLYAYLNSHKLARAPGSQREYSNVGMGLLGELLASEQKLTFEQLLLKRIAEPLQLASTTVNVDANQLPRLASPHLDVDVPTSGWDAPALAGAGMIKSTARDMIRFTRASLSPPENELGEALELAWKVHQKPLAPGEPAMGLGWGVVGGKTRMHNGQTGGYHSMLLVNRERHASVILLTNTSTAEVDRLAQDVVRMVLGTEVKPRVFKKQHQVKPDVLARYVGKYQLAPGLELSVTSESGKLMVQLTGQPAVRIYPDSDTKWHLRVVPAKLTFNVDDDGQCTSVELFQNGMRQTAKRLDGGEMKQVKVKPEVMARYVGKYQFTPGIELAVAMKDDQLTVQLTGQQPLQIYPDSDTKWHLRVVPAKITFNVNRAGKCTSVELFQNGVRQTARRLD